MNPKPQQSEVPAVDAVETVSDTSQTDAFAEIPDPDFEIPSEPPSNILGEKSPVKRRILPDKATDLSYSSWKMLIPFLIEPHLKYSARTLATALEITPRVISACATLSCPQKRTSITCLFFDILLHHGLFPTAPSQPLMAVSIELLSFYRALFEWSCDAINALASALKTHYSRRGFVMTDTRGEIIQDPFFQIERQVEEALQNSRDWVATLHPQTEDHVSTSSPLSTLCRGCCAPILIQRCPACFGGTMFGKPTADGGDIHTATDGNFHHRHWHPTYFIPKQFVDDVGRRIEAQRKRPANSAVPLVPDEAIDQCETAYEAADGKKQKAAMDSFDDTGIMALIFVALYDVGCVLAQSLSKYDILPHSIVSRLRFATTAMHAYGHEWACQLVYNPRMCIGLGLSDGEGTERLWSRMVRLIGVERSSSRQRHLWLINHQAAAIGSEMQTDLDAPARLKKELDTVLTLQADLDTSDTALQSTRLMLEKGTASHDTLEALERGHDRLMAKVEVLYASLNIHDQFPELEGINLDFIRLLLMVCDLKMNIHKQAITSFFEWDKLDHAVGSAQQALGTKLHQQTRKAIAKCQPALLTALRKFNAYCERLEVLYDPSDPSLMEDVWITPSTGQVPQWLEDADRCREEQKRLGIEADNLCHFFGEELAALKLALCTPGCELISVLLRQRRNQLLRLQTRWANPLASSLRFTSRAKDALEIAITLSGGVQSPNVHWLSTTLLEVPDPEGELSDVEFAKPLDLPVVEFEHAALADVIENDLGTITGRELPSRDGYPHQIFEPKDIALLTSPTAFLNDTCINGCAVLLFSELKSVATSHCTLLTTHNLPRIRYNTSDNILWHNVSYTHYWEKDVWILPIHRPSNIGHWVLKELHLFDSLAEKKPWKNNVKDVMKLIAHLLAIAHQRHHHITTELDRWTARPLKVSNTLNLWVHTSKLSSEITPVQTNSYDCGVWVLAAIAADDMHHLRHYLRALVLSVPCL
ncbi:hypothetical protein BDR05DRAFT_978861 [Suillus weaverae]|nr:hypothetical protein BDR05DRAFT_978861 [Suillus weaverae]